MSRRPIKNEKSIPGAVYLRSLGAAGTVTGSKHLLKTPGFNLLIDCGLFQGLKQLREKNWEPLSADASSIDAMILTHAHLDHCGYIPLLVKQGFKGKIFMSEPTRYLAELILRDSAKLQEEDAWKANKHHYTKHHPAKPLYDTADVEAALPHFRTVGLDATFRLSDDVWFRFYKAGHIQGACCVDISCYGKSILFSGDIGRYHSELMPPPDHPGKADFVIMESTYGDRLHDEGSAADELAGIINDTIDRGGNLLVPCFAVGRAQEVIHLVYKLKQQKTIPQALPVYLDSPMASSAGEALLSYPDWITIGKNECIQMFNGITINQDFAGTRRIIDRRGSKMILSASGMLTGGRVLEYLKDYLTDDRNTILIIGFQAGGTRGRALLNGAHELKIHGRYYPVRARVHEIGGLSAHADQAELLTWLKAFTPKPGHVYLVHGEPSAMDTLRVKIGDELRINVRIAVQDQDELLFEIKPE
ncbi:MAG: MBL fold metallo-hydrolase [Bacteroidetes bacterium]|nr:MBL fold metallo-hydrolase [Bacteroidota bacterium]